MVSIDLAEVESTFRVPFLWSTGRWSLFRFCRADYLGPADRPLADCVREAVAEKLGRQIDGPIRLLTQIRCCGFAFNPISLYYCFDAEKQLRAIVADVTNTPWGERHCYAIPVDGADRITHYASPKEFHVSPFMPMEMEYRWRVSQPDDRLTVQIDNLRGEERVFDASLDLSRRELSFWNVFKVAVRLPLMSVQIVAAIYWHALLLWWKKTPYFPHPPTHHQTSPNDPTPSSLVP